MAIRRNRIDKLIDHWSPIARRAFMQSINNIRSQARIDDIARMLERNDVEAAIRAVGLNPAQFRPFDKALANSFEAGGNFAAASIPAGRATEGFRTVFQFNIRNPTAERWLADYAGNKVVEIINDQRIMLRETFVDALSRGLNPRSAALDIVGRIGRNGTRQGGYLGLTSSQAQWVRNYRDELRSDNPLDALNRNLRDRRFDAAVRRAASRGEALTQDQIDDMVTSYEARALRYRAENIARTEMIRSLHEAQQQAMQQAIAEGSIRPDAVSFIWRTARDSRVRDIHETMEGQEAELGQFFIDGDGNQLAYPGDPSAPPETTVQCRCFLEPNINFFLGVE